MHRQVVAPSHGVPAPTLEDLRDSVIRAARGRLSVWTSVCRVARDAPYQGRETELWDRLLDAAREQGGAVSAAAEVFGSRLHAHRTLSRSP